MKDDMVTYSKCLRQRMRKKWTLPLQFLIKEHILTLKKKIAMIVSARTADKRDMVAFGIKLQTLESDQ